MSDLETAEQLNHAWDTAGKERERRLAAEAQRDQLAEALRRYANEAPEWLKHIAKNALADVGLGEQARKVIEKTDGLGRDE